MFINKMHLDINDTFGFQFDLDILSNFTEITPSFSHIVSYPVVERDLNFVLDENILIGDLISTIAHNGKDILKSVEPSNIFRNKSLGENKKSVTINFIFQSPTKTLEDKDVNFVINEIIKVISSKYSAKLR
jgi:phenylalanyl-tRNA synthetase beta chain